MKLKQLKYSFILLAIFSLKKAYSATDLSDIVDSSTQTITAYQECTQSAATKTLSGVTFTSSPSGSYAIADLNFSNGATFNGCTFDGVTFLMTGSTGLTFSTTPSIFNQAQGAPYIAKSSTGSITFNVSPIFNGNGYIDISSDTIFTLAGSVNLTCPIRIASGKILTIDLNAATSATLSGGISGDGNLTLSGFNKELILSGQHTLKGTINLAGNTLTLLNANVSNASQINLASGTLKLAGTTNVSAPINFNLSSSSITADANAIATLSGNIDLSADGNLTTGNNALVTINGIISGSINTLTKAGAGTLTLTKNNTIDSLDVTAGTLNVSENASICSDTCTLSGNAIVNYLASTVVNHQFSVTGNATINTPLNVNVNQTNQITIAPSTTLKKTGKGTFTLTLTSNTGTLDLQEGRLNINNTSNSINFMASNAATMGFVGNYSLFNLAINAPLTIDVPSTITGTIGGTITGSFPFIKTGKGTLALNQSSSTYTAIPSVNEGILSISGADAVGANKQVTVAPGASLLTATNLTFSSTGTTLQTIK